MVVFEDGLPKRSDYRKFEIKGVPGQDDFASMEEMLRRRFNRLIRERDEPVTSSKRRFAYPPSLVVVDGGRGQLGVAARCSPTSAWTSRTSAWRSGWRRSTSPAGPIRC